MVYFQTAPTRKIVLGMTLLFTFFYRNLQNEYL
jgi:hypothetical protein